MPTLLNRIIPTLANIETKKHPLSALFKYKHVTKFRHKADSRTYILNRILPREYNLSNTLLFYSIYFDETLNLEYKDAQSIKIEQMRILEFGSNLLILRLYNYFLTNNPNRKKSIGLLDEISPENVNTIKIRHDFINQFNNLLDSKNLLAKVSSYSSIRTIKLERRSRHKILPMLIGLIHFQYGIERSHKFVDEWVIKGKWSTRENYNHKGMVQIYTEKKLNVF